MTDRVGERLGNYHLLRLLGRGGFAEVYLGEHVSLKTYAALKLLRTQLAHEDAEDFLLEAQKLARLNHPHIMRVLDFAVQEGTPFLVMEYAPGGTLRMRHRKERQLPLETIVGYVSQIASALQYAHDHRLIHRDVKPENMLLGSRQEVLLSDFGLAIFASHTHPYSTLELPQQMAGTSLYLAPEQLSGRPHPQSDQYALGIVVYEWLTGKLPFHGTLLEVAMQHLSLAPPSLREHVPDLAPAIEEVVMRTLAKEPLQRFASVHDFASALQHAAQKGRPLHSTLLSASEPAASMQKSSFSEPKSTASFASFQEPEEQNQPESEPMWNMPTFPTPFIGREQEVASLCAMLRQAEVRLLTLVGMGGIGKTRLGVEVATQLRAHFADGVCFVGLAPVSNPDLVVSTIADALRIRAMPGRPLGEQVRAELARKQVLLLLDNFEQVAEAASIVEELLLACSHLSVLITSRAVLHLQAEHLFPVHPLALPDLSHPPSYEVLIHSPAILLFQQRARAVLPTFHLTSENVQTIAEICVRLNGLPLAIELAAARIRLLPPQALLSRLTSRLQVLTGGARTLPPRQQTLRKTLQWSYDLLSPQEQQLFRRLSVFVSSYSLEIVEALYHELGDQTSDVLNSMASLLDNSFIQQDEQTGNTLRFLMLETVREYGLECLRESGEGERCQFAHAEYYLTLAERAEPHLRGGSQQLRWLTVLTEEQENLRAALQWVVEHEETERALRLSGATWWYWFMRSSYDEALHWLEASLMLPDTGERTTARAQVLAATGFLIGVLRGDVTKACPLLEESMALYQERGDRRGYAHALQFFASMYEVQGDYRTARTLGEQAVDLCRALGDDWKVAFGLNDLARVTWALGDAEAAAALWQECIALGRKIGERWGLPRPLAALATLLVAQGDYVQALELAQEGLAIAQEMGDMETLMSLLALQVEGLMRQDDVQAVHLVQEGLASAREMGDQERISIFLRLMGDIAQNQGNLKQATDSYRESLTLALQPARMKELVGRCLLGLAKIAKTEKRFQRAAHLFGAAEPWLNVNVSLSPIERAAYASEVAEVQAHLGGEPFAAAWSEGRSLTPEQVLTTPTLPGTPAQDQPQSSRKASPSKSIQATSSTDSARPELLEPLSERELEVLRLMADGQSNSEIARTLFVSMGTVKTHLRHIYGKLDAHTRTQAVARARMYQLLSS